MSSTLNSRLISTWQNLFLGASYIFSPIEWGIQKLFPQCEQKNPISSFRAGLGLLWQEIDLWQYTWYMSKQNFCKKNTGFKILRFYKRRIWAGHYRTLRRPKINFCVNTFCIVYVLYFLAFLWNMKLKFCPKTSTFDLLVH